MRESNFLPIGSLVDIRRGASPRPIKDFLTDHGMPWVKIADATGQKDRFISYTKECISQDGISKSVIVNPEDLIISNSATPCLPKIMKIRACVHDGWLVVSNYKGITRDYLFYAIKANKKWILNQGNGSIFTNLKTDILKEFKINVPTISEQERISRILTHIDSKIELNTKINVQLAQMARLIYEFWFVQYDFPNEKGMPYKTSGGAMHYNEEVKRNIPVGWEVKKLDDVLNVSRGASPRPIGDYICEEGLPWIKISDATKSDNRFIIETKQFIKTEGESKTRVLESDSLILSNSASPAIPKIVKIRSGIHDGWLLIKDFKHSLSKEYMFQYFEYERPRIIGFGSGSIFKNLKTDYVKDLKIVIPPRKLLEDSSETFLRINDKIFSHAEENQKLIEMRNWLLPMLMNGQVKVN